MGGLGGYAWLNPTRAAPTAAAPLKRMLPASVEYRRRPCGDAAAKAIMAARLGESKEKFVMHDHREGVRLTIFLEFALVAPPDVPELTGFEDALREYDDVIVDTRELQLN